MNEPGPDPENLTWQQLLAAYADGELDEMQRRQIERTLARSPDAASELTAQRRFSPDNQQLWQQVRMPEPTPAQWSAVWQNVENRVHPTVQPARSTRPRTPWLRRGLLALALALPTTAAASVALVMSLSPSNRPAADQPAESDDAVFRLTQPDDVEINSIRYSDQASLVVGRPPLAEAMTLVSSADVTLDEIKPDRDGFLPQVQMGPDGPMIFAPPHEP